MGQAPNPEVGYRTAAVIGGNLALFGGATIDKAGQLQLCDAVWLFDLEQLTWNRGTKLPAPLRDSSAVALDERFVLIAGGVEDAKPKRAPSRDARVILTHRCWLYDLVENKFIMAEPLRLAVADNGLANVDGKLFVIGGEDSPYRTRTDVVQRGRWRSSEPFAAESLTCK